MRIRIASIVLVATLSGGLASCNDKSFLTEVPVDFVGPGNFYRNSGDAIAAVNAVYAAFINGTGDLYYGRNFIMLIEYTTEVATSGRLGGTNERSLPDNFSFDASHAYIEGVWSSAYAAINRANAVIDNVPRIDMDATLKARIIGEAKFLRALHYFNLVRMFGGVPIRTTETTSSTDLAIERSTAAQVYDQIVSDLNEAIAALPPKASYAAGDRGRATIGAARTLLGKVYLQRGATGVGTTTDFAAAEAVLRQVTASGEYSLVPNVMTLWDFYGGTVVENNTEVIFDIQNTRAPGLGGRISSHMAPNSTAPFLGASTNGSIAAELNFFLSYDPADARRNATFLLSWNRGATVNTWAPPPASQTSAANVAYGSHTPFPRKYLDILMPSTGAEEPNTIILRYADVLLMLAEAINEQAGPTPEAQGFVNQVRARAGLAALPAAATASAATFKDAIFQERRWELAFEGHGFFDSQRNWNWSKARVEANLVLGRTSGQGNRYPRPNPGSPCVGTPGVCTLTDKFKLFPIPQRAIDVNPQLTQNPGWGPQP